MSNSFPLVSIVIPSYNNSAYLRCCVLSAINQTYSNIEIIIADDCSTDDSRELATQIKEEYPNINIKLVFHEQNYGACENINIAIMNYATGKYIKLIDSDDFLTNECVEILVDTIESGGDKVGIVYGCTQHFIVNSKKKIILLNEFYGHDVNYESLLYSVCGIVPASTLFRKDYFIQFGGFPKKSHIGDLYLWLKILKSYEYRFVNKVVSFYQITSNTSSLTKNVPKMLSSLMMILINQFNDDGDITFDSVCRLNKRFQNEFLFFIVKYIDSSIKADKGKAIRLYKENFFFLLNHKQFKFLCTFWIKLLIR